MTSKELIELSYDELINILNSLKETGTSDYNQLKLNGRGYYYCVDEYHSRASIYNENTTVSFMFIMKGLNFYDINNYRDANPFIEIFNADLNFEIRKRKIETFLTS